MRSLKLGLVWACLIVFSLSGWVALAILVGGLV